MTTAEKVARLKTLAAKAGESLFERVKLAAEVLADREWLQAEYGDDYDAALAALQGNAFPDLTTVFGLARLLLIHGTFPDKREWQERKWNLQVLWDDYTERKKTAEGDKPKSERRAVKLVEFEQLKEEKENIEYQQRQATSTIQTLMEENARLRAENAELKGENRVLREQLTETKQRRGVLVPA